MTTPQRVQQRRTKGWRKPEGAISVARPHKWGNPFKVGEHGISDAENAARLYRQWLPGTPLRGQVSELAGHDLMCFCPLDQHCHGLRLPTHDGNHPHSQPRPRREGRGRAERPKNRDRKRHAMTAVLTVAARDREANERLIGALGALGARGLRTHCYDPGGEGDAGCRC